MQMRGDARGTWLVAIPLALILVGFGVCFILGIWASVPIARGWLRLDNSRMMPVQSSQAQRFSRCLLGNQRR